MSARRLWAIFLALSRIDAGRVVNAASSNPGKGNAVTDMLLQVRITVKGSVVGSLAELTQRDERLGAVRVFLALDGEVEAKVQVYLVVETRSATRQQSYLLLHGRKVRLQQGQVQVVRCEQHKRLNELGSGIHQVLTLPSA